MEPPSAVRPIDTAGANDGPVVSTGSLPAPEHVRVLLYEALERFGGVADGRNSDVYPALASMPDDLFGLCVVGVDGSTYAVGDAEHPFTIMSVSKPFVFALVCQELGADEARSRLGVNSTGLPFNSVMAIELNANRLTNPMVNAGAIAATSLVPGATVEEKWKFILDGLSRFAGRQLDVNEEVYVSATATNHRNRGIARLLYSYNRCYFEPEQATDLYTRQCSLTVNCVDLAAMGATLADGGLNPLTGEQVIDAQVCKKVLAVMATAGMYETSGDWLHDVGLPGKSGIGGGIITVAPGKGSLAAFAPPLDDSGNSVKGQLATRFLSEELGLNIFASRPVGPGGDVGETSRSVTAGSET